MPPRRRRPAARSAAEIATLVEQIRERRARCRPEDPDLDRFPDPGDLIGVVAYIARYQRVPDEVLRADAVAQLAILDHLREDVDRRTLAAIRLARRCGTTWAKLAGPLGVGSAQGAEQTAQRLVNSVERYGTKDEKALRREKKAAEQSRREPAPPGSPLTAFLDLLYSNRDQLSDDIVENMNYLREKDPSSLAFRVFMADLIDDLREAGVDGPIAAAADHVAALLVS